MRQNMNLGELCLCAFNTPKFRQASATEGRRGKTATPNPENRCR